MHSRYVDGVIVRPLRNVDRDRHTLAAYLDGEAASVGVGRLTRIGASAEIAVEVAGRDSERVSKILSLELAAAARAAGLTLVEHRDDDGRHRRARPAVASATGFMRRGGRDTARPRAAPARAAPAGAPPGARPSPAAATAWAEPLRERAADASRLLSVGVGKSGKIAGKSRR
jgi:hypothetical protein